MTHDELLIEETRNLLVSSELFALKNYKDLLSDDFVIPTFEELYKRRFANDPR